LLLDNYAGSGRRALESSASSLRRNHQQESASFSAKKTAAGREAKRRL
jgi:hypothetical protein